MTGNVYYCGGKARFYSLIWKLRKSKRKNITITENYEEGVE